MDEWQFCEASLPLLQRCIAAAKHTDNKWHKHFNKQTTETILLDSHSPVHENETPDITEREVIEELADLHRLDFDEVTTMCLNNKQTYKQLAKQPIVYIEKLCEYVFKNKNVNEEFLEEFYSSFLPVLLKRDDIKLCMDLLMKAKQNGGLDKLLDVVIKDLEIPKMVLQELVLTMESKVEVLEKILVFDNEVFIYHLNTIYLIYKESRKSEELQKQVLSQLAQAAPVCESDKCFGRFLLSFLQVQKEYADGGGCEELQQLVDTHTSLLKAPCVCALNEIRKRQNL